MTNKSTKTEADLRAELTREQDARYEEAKRRAGEILVRATARGARSWRRDELHERLRPGAFE